MPGEGVLGGLGSEREIGPTAADVQLFSFTVMLSYVPEPRLLIVIVPVALVVSRAVIALFPSLL